MRQYSGIFGILLMVAPSGASSDPQLSYGGFTVDTTIAELKERYPRSTFNDSNVTISAVESHDYILFVRVEMGRVKLGLGTKSGTYDSKPRCFDFLGPLTKLHGDATSKRRDVHDGPALLRVYIWTRGDENLELQCEDIGRQVDASRVEFYRTSDGAT